LKQLVNSAPIEILKIKMFKKHIKKTNMPMESNSVNTFSGNHLAKEHSEKSN
jgi:hypothetical protein